MEEPVAAQAAQEEKKTSQQESASAKKTSPSKPTKVKVKASGHWT
jgi:hypothetical protein